MRVHSICMHFSLIQGWKAILPVLLSFPSLNPVLHVIEGVWFSICTLQGQLTFHFSLILSLVII